ncbi:OmpH family outer membrane protein [Phaeobacter sp. QD34_3]|uniref:OmpH family outer membrane protein n=1 Tax=unclassified Phaeobacter TaxID=2621772 RepID=UPI00237F8420|nr:MULTISPECIES: OmpH family outer membrane protein [unclassified Phaeobacter]MDE4131627.1 OmpH family outer membrane protein [Phaeobacter sp. QD34_3]MDE4135284.1 OmpH family outer membrane protein [Phaeobacter sp. QD34_24]
MSQGRYRRVAAIALAISACALVLDAGQAQAQGTAANRMLGITMGQDLDIGVPLSGILTIQPDRLFSESAFGQRINRELEAEGAVLTAENRRVEAELRAEELELTERRPSMEPEAFRALADAFDQKVQETRRTQVQKLQKINQMGETARREFFVASLPILQAIMRDSGAGAILDHSSVFLSSEAADVTELAITRIDAVLGDGSDMDRETTDP